MATVQIQCAASAPALRAHGAASTARPLPSPQLRLRSPSVRIARTHQQHVPGRRTVVLRRAGEGETSLDADMRKDLEAEAEEFMRLQAAEESGVKEDEVKAPITATSGITDEDVQRYLNEIFEIVQDLEKKRSMNKNEIKLTLMIEDPRVAERRRKLGIEADTGVSRDELAAAFEEVVQGGIPGDRLALKVLAEEMAEWPFLDGSSQGEAPSGRKISAIADTGDEKDTGGMPDFVGYGMLYGVSAVPIFIVVAVVTVLFVNSLR